MRPSASVLIAAAVITLWRNDLADATPFDPASPITDPSHFQQLGSIPPPLPPRPLKLDSIPPPLPPRPQQSDNAPPPLPPRPITFNDNLPPIPPRPQQFGGDASTPSDGVDQPFNEPVASDTTLVAPLDGSDSEQAPTPQVPRLFFEKFVSRKGKKIYTALVRYEGKPGFLKCTRVKQSFDNERIALETIHAGDPNKHHMSPHVKKAFAGLMGVLPPEDGKYCLVVTRVTGESLDEYAMSLSNPDKDEILPFVFSQAIAGVKYMNYLGLVHGDIKPENIMITRSSDKMKPIVTIIDFDLSQVVGESGIAMYYGGTMGYLAPEDTLKVPTNLYKRETWMMGATLYAALTNRPPYTSMGLLKTARNLGRNMFLPVRSSENRQLVELMKKMMICNPAQRPRLSELNDTLLKSFTVAAPAA
ncbi:kinase-like domain-containing protein [Thamnocephalis sphaerospora]|uniref:Kinase-like domain-containing protein n=1 Tax=Thamnocephalis sphaerospora TaxID=78915 RepID=A0A4P9XLA9_9FUNG|nr:kinase-like domain-containing protein [Thamnocephalis sphaerospora]|eukprot:RKP06637.1 kinase-like domain-containing protein [Thamnocephalis sphaerospora]